MPLKILRKPVEVSFDPPTAFSAKPFGIVAEIANQDHVERHRTSAYTREKYFIHVSDLMQAHKNRRFCPRQHALSFIENRQGHVRKISPGMRLLHRMGHAIQEQLTDDFIHRSPYGDKTWGNWRCKCGHTTIQYDLRPRAGTCTRCGFVPDIYDEITILYNKYNVIGHPDLVILWNGILHIYEIKTIDRSDVSFDALEAPLGDHTLQATFYFWIMTYMHEQGLIKYPVDPVANYVYVDRRSNKKLFYGKMYKEFSKRVSPLDRIKPMFESAEVLKQSLEQSVLPTRICSGPNTPRAKNCNVCVTCFNRNRFNV